MQYAQQRSPGSNAIGIGLVVVLHLGVGYALLQSVGWGPMKPAPVPLTATVIEPEKKIIEPPPPPPPTKIEPQKLDFVPIPTFTVKNLPPSDTQRTVTTIPPTTQDPPTRTASIEPPAPPAETRAGAKRLAGPPLVYPGRARSMGLEGWVDVQCDVDDMGSTSNCSMIAHDGINAFVEEALDFVRATRYSPATRNGVPVAEKEHRFHISFTLTDK